MSKFSTFGLAPGFKILRNIEQDKVADLFGFSPSGKVVGFYYNGGQNQKFNFANVGGNNYQITTGSNRGPVYINSTPEVNAEVTAGNATTYTVTPADGGNFHISVKNKEGQSLYWTLSLPNDGTIITLQPGGGGRTQIWDIYNTN